MLIEWLRRRDARFDKELRDYLFTDKPLATLEQAHAGKGKDDAAV